MPPDLKPPSPRVAAFLDLGTNSARLLIVRISENLSYTIISRQKQMVRLGAGEFENQTLMPEAMDRAVRVCRDFAELARAHGADELIAVATSATREAENEAEFVRRLKKEAGVRIRVVSGKEEARLIYLGVASGFDLKDRTALFVDIGGGSTEVIVGDARRYFFLDSMKLGAIRLAGRFLEGAAGPVSPKKYASIKSHARNSGVRAWERIKSFPFHLAVGSSGTIENLAEIADQAVNQKPPAKPERLSYNDLCKTAELLCSLPLAERRKVKGINPARADIIVAGAAILDALMEELNVPEIFVSDRGLKDGLVTDYLSRTEVKPLTALPVRERSVLQLGRNCRFDEAHARNVSNLSLALFDGARALGLHALGDWERDLLKHSAMLHDIGTFLSYNNHHAHSYYLILNSDMLGFNQEELAIMAATAFFHRKTLPRKKHSEFAALDEKSRELVQVLSVFLRIAESLDRSHAGLVQSVSLLRGGKKSVILEIHSAKDCQLEMWSLRNHHKAFERTFGRPLVETCAPAAGGGGSGKKIYE
jgi:exopolyphosphatase/guanosine-5'-triphosphate,3'-diphosphate pyrophosphatase